MKTICYFIFEIRMLSVRTQLILIVLFFSIMFINLVLLYTIIQNRNKLNYQRDLIELSEHHINDLYHTIDKYFDEKEWEELRSYD